MRAPKRFQPLQMQVHRTRADRAAARQRHARSMAPRQQWAKHPEAGAHPPDHVVRRGGVDDVARGQMERIALLGRTVGALAVQRGIDAVVSQDPRKIGDIREVRHVLKRERVRCEQAGDHQRKRGVFRAADWNSAFERDAAGHANLVHFFSQGCVMPLSRRFSPPTPVLLRCIRRRAQAQAGDQRPLSRDGQRATRYGRP